VNPIGINRSAARRRARRRLSRSSFGCEPLEARRLFAAGDLDPSFDGDGYTSTTVPGAQLSARDVAVQADGKTVVAGYVGAADGFAVTRYNLNGTPDTTFGPDHNGTVLLRGGSSSASAVAIQPDGKIVVMGSWDLSDTRVVRLNPDGGPDRTFGGGDGSITFDPVGLTEYATFEQVIIQPDGKILLGGDALTGILDSDFDLIFARLNPDGSFDSSFDGDGIKSVGFGINERFGGMAIDFSGTPATNPDFNKIIAAGIRWGADPAQAAVLVTRLTAGGAVDNTYDGDGNGQVHPPGGTSPQVTGVVVEDDGRIVVGGYYATGGLYDYALVRFLHTGPLDTTFGPAGTGWARTSIGRHDVAGDLIIAPSGGLVLGGYSEVPVLGGTEKRDALAYYTPDGLPDTRFGGDGTITYAATDASNVSVASGPGRRIVFAGGGGMHAARIFDVGANLVYATTLSPTASETGPTSRGFILYRLERLPVATRVYFSVGGAATAPTFRAIRDRSHDYTTDGLVFPIPFPGGSTTPYVDIPANATFVSVIITPIDDAVAEGNETAVFTIRPDAAYEVGDPHGATLIIADNDAPPPTIERAWVRGSAWKGTDGDALNTTFKEYLAATGIGDAEYGYRADNVGGVTLPWTNVNQVVLQYTAPPTGAGIPAVGAVSLDGVRSDYAVTSVEAIDPRTFLLTLDRPLGTLPAAQGGGSNGDRFTLSVPGGAAGATYTLALSTLPGDADRAGGRVNALDLGFLKARANRNATEPPPATGLPYSPFADLNADGRINALDLGALKARLNDALPAATFASRVSPASTAALPLFDDRRDDNAVSSRPADVLG